MKAKMEMDRSVEEDGREVDANVEYKAEGKSTAAPSSIVCRC